MAGHSFGMFGWNWTEASVLGSQVFRQALIEGCDEEVCKKGKISLFLHTTAFRHKKNVNKDKIKTFFL